MSSKTGDRGVIFLSWDYPKVTRAVTLSPLLKPGYQSCCKLASKAELPPGSHPPSPTYTAVIKVKNFQVPPIPDPATAPEPQASVATF